jgi:hypothetical protein
MIGAGFMEAPETRLVYSCGHLISLLFQNRTRDSKRRDCSPSFACKRLRSPDGAEKIGVRKMPENSKQIKIFSSAVGCELGQLETV